MKIYHNVAQGSGEWFKLRQGIPTASNFHKIITPQTGKLSASSLAYAYQLVAERLLNQPGETIEGQSWMERGKELEPQAVAQYQFVNEVETVPVGFITTDDGLIGASPDRLVKGAARALEIKCPSPHVHLRYLIEGAAESYRPQVQGQIFVAELDDADFYAYHPRMPACTIRTLRDEPYIKLLCAALDEFVAKLACIEERARTLGVFQALAEAATPTDLERAAGLGRGFLQELGLPEEIAP